MRNKKGQFCYLICTADALELPLYYAYTGQEASEWLGVSLRWVYTAFMRAKRDGRPPIVKIAGYQVEYMRMEGSENI